MLSLLFVPGWACYCRLTCVLLFLVHGTLVSCSLLFVYFSGRRWCLLLFVVLFVVVVVVWMLFDGADVVVCCCLLLFVVVGCNCFCCY